MSRRGFLVLAAFVGLAFAAFGGQRAAFTYQGRLCDSSGTAVPAASYNVTVRLWDADGDAASLLWARETQVLTDADGLFHIEMSDELGERPQTAPNVPLAEIVRRQAERDLYVGLEVRDSAGEVRPRQKVATVPYASYAHDASAALEGFAVRGTLRAQSVRVSGAVNFTGTFLVAGGFAACQDASVGTLSAVGDSVVGGAAEVDGKGRFGGLVSSQGVTATNMSVGALAVGDVGIRVNGINLDLRKGMIVMWYGSRDRVPEGWVLCDGSNGTPDLRGRFVVGAGATMGQGGKASDGAAEYALNDRAGSETVTLGESQVPKHFHTIRFHEKDLALASTSDRYAYSATDGRKGGPDVSPLESTRTGGENGMAQPHENMPAYFAVHYIMRVAE